MIDAISPSALRARVFKLAWPVILEMLLQTLLGIVDTIMVGRLGADALAGVGAAQQFVFFVIAVLSAVTIGSSILSAQATGARDGATASRVAKQSLIWSLLISVPIAVLGVTFALDLMRALGVTADVAAVGQGYLTITMGAAAILVVPFAAGAVLRGAGDTRTPLTASLWANVVNVVVAYVLIFGAFGAPALGTNGSAWAAVAGRLVSCVILLAALWRGRSVLSIRGRAGWWLESAIARRVVGLGAPAALEQIVMSAGFTVMLRIVADLGTEALAAQRIAGMALSLSLLPGFGFAIAATALVGQSIGANRHSEGVLATYIATRWAAIWMGVVGAAYILLGTPIALAFTDDPGVVALAAACLLPVGFIQPIWAIGIVMTGALRGGGNTRYPLYLTTVLIWGNVGIAFVTTNLLLLPLPYVWAGFLLISPITGYLALRRFRRGDWQTIVYRPAAVVVADGVG